MFLWAYITEKVKTWDIKKTQSFTQDIAREKEI